MVRNFCRSHVVGLWPITYLAEAIRVWRRAIVYFVWIKAYLDDDYEACSISIEPDDNEKKTASVKITINRTREKNSLNEYDIDTDNGVASTISRPTWRQTRTSQLTLGILFIFYFFSWLRHFHPCHTCHLTLLHALLYCIFHIFRGASTVGGGGESKWNLEDFASNPINLSIEGEITLHQWSRDLMF